MSQPLPAEDRLLPRVAVIGIDEVTVHIITVGIMRYSSISHTRFLADDKEYPALPADASLFYITLSVINLNRSKFDIINLYFFIDRYANH